MFFWVFISVIILIGIQTQLDVPNFLKPNKIAASPASPPTVSTTAIKTTTTKNNKPTPVPVISSQRPESFKVPTAPLTMESKWPNYKSEHLASLSSENILDLPWELQDCDFQSLENGAAPLSWPLDIAESINLRQWQAAYRQLRELKRLSTIHEAALITQYGLDQFQSFLSDLDTLVGKPLRFGCSTLERLQSQLYEIKDINILQGHELQPILSNILREAHIDLLNYNLGTNHTHLIPSWARHAPELQSRMCADRDCFRIGEEVLDIVTLQIPDNILEGVQKAQSITGPNGPFLKALALLSRYLERTATLLSKYIARLYTVEIVAGVLAIAILFLIKYSLGSLIRRVRNIRVRND
ncbi:hypothetical protein F4808DRAFT_456646 [Astrocystis sublimbata]|nr:hypothetical protein F4808DRAFT_456646 [Astrocystis sublimbata]